MLKQPEVLKILFQSGMEPVGGSPEQLGATVKAEIEQMSKLIKAAGIGVQTSGGN